MNSRALGEELIVSNVVLEKGRSTALGTPLVIIPTPNNSQDDTVPRQKRIMLCLVLSQLHTGRNDNVHRQLPRLFTFALQCVQGGMCR